MNKQQGQHPLRERAKKIDQGILVIRQVGLVAIMRWVLVDFVWPVMSDPAAKDVID